MKGKGGIVITRPGIIRENGKVVKTAGTMKMNENSGRRSGAVWTPPSDWARLMRKKPERSGKTSETKTKRKKTKKPSRKKNSRD